MYGHKDIYTRKRQNMQPKFTSNPRVPFQLSTERPPLAPPKGKPLIVHLLIAIENWRFDDHMPRQIIPGPHGARTIPDVVNYSWAEYGMRCGMPRLFRMLGERNLRADACINAGVLGTRRSSSAKRRHLDSGAGGAAAGIGLAVPDLRGILRTASHASVWWLVLGVALEVGSCLGYVLVVRHVLYRGPPRELRWLAWAEQAFGAVVPLGGAGGLAVGAWAMRAWGVPWSRVANRSAVIFLLTSAVNAAVLGDRGAGGVARARNRRRASPTGWCPARSRSPDSCCSCLTPLVKAPERPQGDARTGSDDPARTRGVGS